jgi:hypothetical protein
MVGFCSLERKTQGKWGGCKPSAGWHDSFLDRRNSAQQCRILKRFQAIYGHLGCVRRLQYPFYMKNLSFYLAFSLFLGGNLLTLPSAFAGNMMAALGGVKPSSIITKGQCDIKIDCKHYKVTVNGQNAGQIICGPQTGSRFANKTVKLMTTITPAGGKILPKGFPMLSTNPPLCSNCFIHVYPWVGPGHKSLGCVGVTAKAWKQLTKCGGSEIAFVTNSGLASNVPASHSRAIASTPPVSAIQSASLGNGAQR